MGQEAAVSVVRFDVHGSLRVVPGEVVAPAPAEVKGRPGASAGRFASLDIAAGGDGTVSTVANRTPLGTPVTVLPLGTENLLAKYLDIPPDAQQISQIIHRGCVALERLSPDAADRHDSSERGWVPPPKGDATL